MTWRLASTVTCSGPRPSANSPSMPRTLLSEPPTRPGNSVSRLSATCTRTPYARAAGRYPRRTRPQLRPPAGVLPRRPLPPAQTALAVVPAYNEAATIASVISALREHAPQFDVLVVDDGSTDDTSQLARAAGARVVRPPFNLGIDRKSTRLNSSH